VDLDRQRLGREQIFDQQVGPTAARILEPDFADRVALRRDRSEHGRQIAPTPDFLDAAGDEASGGHSGSFRQRGGGTLLWTQP
jgi:hypothetical protein